LRSGVLDAFGIGYIHCNDVEPAAGAGVVVNLLLFGARS
jgi:hypothetical protein